LPIVLTFDLFGAVAVGFGICLPCLEACALLILALDCWAH